MLRTIAVASLLLSTAAPALAQVPPGNSAPQPVPFVDTIPVMAAAAPAPWMDGIGVNDDWQASNAVNPVVKFVTMLSGGSFAS